VLAIEAMAAAQALDFVVPLKTGSRGQKAYQAIRAVSPSMQKDRVMYEDFSRIADVIADGKISEVLI
jgi:histidine ammonia-lyase